MTPVAAPVREDLEALNAGFRSERRTSELVLLTEYRVGRYGLRYSRDGYASRGFGGERRHVVVATVIAAVLPGCDWKAYCGDSFKRDDPRRLREWADHEAQRPWHWCRQPKPGDLYAVRPVCVDANAVGRGAFEPSEADTDAVDCSNCLVRFFGEAVEPRQVVEAREKARRAEERARKPPPPRCPWCGDVRPRTRATNAGEQVPCSRCLDLIRRVHECQYLPHGTYTDYKLTDAEFSGTWREQRNRELLDEAYNELARREGRYLAA